MLIRLLPVAPLPAVLFNISFATLPDALLFPMGWAAQLQCAVADELEMPRCVHALDKAVWMISLLHEVVFSMASMSVTCVFVDGTQEEWTFSDGPCLRALERVVRDTNDAVAAVEYEQLMASPRPVQAAPAPPPTKPAKHRKQRSLLMSFVASLIPISHPSPPSLPQPSPEVHESVTYPKPPAKSSSLYRRSARSTLLDTFRRYVLAELSSRAPEGGYCEWTAQSMLRRTQMQMDALMEETGGSVPDLMPYLHDVRASSSTVPSNPFEDDDEGLSVEGTDTDESSIHTPQDSLRDDRGSWRCSEGSNPNLPRSPSPPVSREDIAQYTALHEECVRLRSILLRMEAAQQNVAAENEALLAVLEVKSKRRAWLNRDFIGGARLKDVGMATPCRSSPLARFDPILPDSLSPQSLLDATSITRDVSVLFPVEEGESDETFPSDVSCELDDVIHIKASDTASMSNYELPPRLRMRANSLGRTYALEMDPLVVDPPTLFVPPPMQASHSSSHIVSSVVDQETCSVPVRVFDAEFDMGTGRGECDEFTLALDVKPFPRRRSSGRCPRFERTEWLSNCVVDCR